MPDRARREIWAGGQFIDGSYTNHAGTRTYKLYIPSGYRGQALPLVVMLHGCMQTPDDFAAGTRMNGLAERELFFVVYPAQTPSTNPSKCWHWFKATDQHRDRGEPSLIAGITRQIVSTYHVNAHRVYIAGLSAGGAMAVIMGVSYPDLYAAIGVHSGLAYGAAHDLPSALAAMQHGGTSAARARDSRFPAAMTTRGVPTIVFHGDRDTTVHPRNGDQVLTHWATTHAGGGPDIVAGTKLRVTVNRGQVPEGHAYTRAIYHDASGHAVMERWLVHEAGHGWSGGSSYGSFTDPKGPDASQAMVRFFYQHSQSES
jgi:poly(hydroxyalkanoate) depolymerase family esterase